MSIKEQIRAEIERLHKAHSGKYGCDEVGLNLEYLEDFLDSLPEQPASDCRETCKGYQETGRCFVDGPCVAKQPVEGLEEERLINTSISFLKDFADKGYENAVECIDWLKSKLNGNSGK